jgi:hypothetical protein
MFDEVPKSVDKKNNALISTLFKGKCPHYSELKRIATKIDEKNNNFINWLE